METEFAPRMDARHAIVRHHCFQRRGCALEGGNQDRRSIVARSDEGQTSSARPGVRQCNRTLAQYRVGNDLFGWIFQQNTERWCCARQQGIGTFCLVDSEAMRDQRVNVESAVGHHVEYGLEIALLSPAY
ncbi:hypothetical protein D3C72_1529830 [compost metagenome]